jgi:Family of unknown function (DUF6340)
MKKASVLLIIIIACYSCSTTNLMSLSVMQPAPVTIPPYIKNIGIVNRSRASDDNKTANAIHNVVSLESNSLITAGAEASISGLADELIKSNRFTEVRPLPVDLRTFGAGVLPSSLSWNTVEKICSENKMDALFSLEFFDTESKLSYAGTSTSNHTSIVNIPVIEQQVNMLTLVKTGWRIYDPSTRNILDEYLISKDIQISGRGINPLVAAAPLAGRSEAVKQAANQAGQTYACRIVPYWIRVSRCYYVGGDDNFVVAKRMAQTGNWDEAAKLWQQETTNSKRKLAGRACYNMAIISEIHGDVDMAIQWAQKAYENYNTPFALRYVNILRDRKADNATLMNQNVGSTLH